MITGTPRIKNKKGSVFMPRECYCFTSDYEIAVHFLQNGWFEDPEKVYHSDEVLDLDIRLMSPSHDKFAALLTALNNPRLKGSHFNVNDGFRRCKRSVILKLSTLQEIDPESIENLNRLNFYMDLKLDLSALSNIDRLCYEKLQTLFRIEAGLVFVGKFSPIHKPGKIKRSRIVPVDASSVSIPPSASLTPRASAPFLESYQAGSARLPAHPPSAISAGSVEVTAVGENTSCCGWLCCWP